MLEEMSCAGPPTNLVAILDGLPVCGNNFMYNKMVERGYCVADIDSWSQSILKNTFRDFGEFQKSVKIEITDKIRDLLTKNPDDKFVLCGVSAMIYPDEEGFDVLTVDVFHCSGANDCQKYWVDITPEEEENFRCPRGSDPKLLETARRAVQ